MDANPHANLDTEAVWSVSRRRPVISVRRPFPHRTSIDRKERRSEYMGIAIVAAIQEKTQWVVSKLSLRRLRSRKRSRKMEAAELQPVALAGASRGFSGPSQPCNTFSRTPSGAYHEQWTDSSGGSSVVSDGKWQTCNMCERTFMPLSMSRQLSGFCSLDCRSAYTLGPGKP